MSSAQSLLTNLIRAALHWMRRPGLFGERRKHPKFNDRQLCAMLALQKSFGPDQRWMTAIASNSTELQSELAQCDWRELARRLTERA